MKFELFEIRPCVEHDGNTQSFLGEPEWHEGIGDTVCTPEGAGREAEAYRAAHDAKPVFWTLYGRCQEGLATAIGDFTSFEDANEVMNAILAVMAEARDVLNHHLGEPIEAIRTKANSAQATLDDFINQCTNNERL